MACRAFMLMILATARGCYCLMEQPATSVMKHLPDMCDMASRIDKLLGCWGSVALPGSTVLSTSRLHAQTEFYGLLWRSHPETNQGLGHSARGPGCLATFHVALRPWMNRLGKPLSTAKRLTLKANSEMLKVAVKHHRPDGSVSVWGAQCMLHSPQHLRSGGPGLKATQVYPDGFGRQVQRLQRKVKDPFKFTCPSYFAGQPSSLLASLGQEHVTEAVQGKDQACVAPRRNTPTSWPLPLRSSGLVRGRKQVYDP